MIEITNWLVYFLPPNAYVAATAVATVGWVARNAIVAVPVVPNLRPPRKPNLSQNHVNDNSTSQNLTNPEFLANAIMQAQQNAQVSQQHNTHNNWHIRSGNNINNVYRNLPRPRHVVVRHPQQFQRNWPSTTNQCTQSHPIQCCAASIAWRYARVEPATAIVQCSQKTTTTTESSTAATKTREQFVRAWQRH